MFKINYCFDVLSTFIKSSTDSLEILSPAIPLEELSSTDTQTHINNGNVNFDDYLKNEDSYYEDNSIDVLETQQSPTDGIKNDNIYELLQQTEVTMESPSLMNSFVDENAHLLSSNTQEKESEESKVQPKYIEIVEHQNNESFANDIYTQIQQKQQQHEEFKKRCALIVEVIQTEYMIQIRQEEEAQMLQQSQQSQQQVYPRIPLVQNDVQSSAQVVQRPGKRKLAAESSSSSNKRKKPEIRAFPCPLCPHVSKRQYNLNSHIKTHDENRVKEFPCDICGRRFDRKNDVGRHKRSVHSSNESKKVKDEQ